MLTGCLSSSPYCDTVSDQSLMFSFDSSFVCSVRYPLMYGPYQLMPREWIVVKRILDKRKFIILPNGGETMHTRCKRMISNCLSSIVLAGSSRNGAKLLLSCLDCPEGSLGEVFNAADEEYLTTRQWVEVIAQALE